MTLWELAACVDGYNVAQGAEAPLEPPTEAEFEAMKENAMRVAESKMVH